MTSPKKNVSIRLGETSKEWLARNNLPMAEQLRQDLAVLRALWERGKEDKTLAKYLESASYVVTGARHNPYELY